MLDTAVLMTQVKTENTYQAQVTFAIARHAAVDLALVLRAHSPDPASMAERLTTEQFAGKRAGRFRQREFRWEIPQVRRNHFVNCAGRTSHSSLALAGDCC